MLERLIDKVRDVVAPDTSKPYAIVCYFDTPAELYHACERLRDEGYRHFDAHTPFPVHGLEHAMGLPPSRLPFLVLGGGTFGLLGGIALCYYTQEVAYAHVIGGKQPFSYQAFVPILFELTVLLSALTCFFGLWALNRLPQFFHAVMQHPGFGAATDDKFFVAIPSADPRYDRDGTRKLLGELGGKEIEEVAP